MSRHLVIACAQMGPIARADTRRQTVARLLDMMKRAKSLGAGLVVFPELALTTFFPRWVFTDPAEIDSFFEKDMPGPETAILFETAARLQIGFYLGYAEIDGAHRFNTSILVDQNGAIVGKYRKVHLPGHAEPQPGREFQHLEKLYFEPGDLGFPVFRAFDGIFGMCICNDRRWPETYRVMGLQDVEVVMLGYNTPIGHTGNNALDGLAQFHNHLSMQAGAYQNATWVVGTAKCGVEEGSLMIGQSCIVAPSGEIVAAARTLEDEVIAANCDLDAGRPYKQTMFDFARHREPAHYRLIVERKGAVAPPL